MTDVVPNAGVIALGKQGENQAVRVTLPNIRAGAGSILLLHQRAADQQPYPVPVVEADGGIIWTVSSTDTAFPGRGQVELQWLGENGEVTKSVTYQTNTTRSMAEPGSVPDEPLKPYTQAVARDAQAAKDAAASATEAARSAEASAGQAGQSAQSAQAAALAAAQNAAAAETAEAGAEQARTGAEAARTEAQTAQAAAEKAAQEAKTAQTGAVEAKTGAETAQAKAEEAAQGVAADREQIGANTAGLEAAQQDVTALKAENTALKAETARTARSLDYLWKKSRGIIYDTETVTGAGSSVTVPSGAMDYAALRMIGGMSQRDVENNGLMIDAQVDEVRVQGRNLLNLLDRVTVSDNVTINVNGGEVNIRGTPPNRAFIFLLVTYTAPAPATYTIAVNSSEQDDSARLIFSVNAGAYISAFPKRTFTVAAGDIVRIYIRISTVANYDVTFRPVIVTGSFADTTFAPYREPITYPIPQTIRDLCPDYGQGTAESYNYIDFAAKAYHHVGSMSQDGTWTALATPEIIDLSAVWPDDFGVLRVEAGGTINLHYPALDDGFELAVPSETEIMVDVAKVVETDG